MSVLNVIKFQPCGRIFQSKFVEKDLCNHCELDFDSEKQNDNKCAFE